MKTKMSKAEKIRAGLEAGKSPAEIAKTVKVPVQSVYTERWKMKKSAVKAKGTKKRILKAVNMVFEKQYEKREAEIISTTLEVLEKELEHARNELAHWVKVISYLNTRVLEFREIQENQIGRAHV